MIFFMKNQKYFFEIMAIRDEIRKEIETLLKRTFLSSEYQRTNLLNKEIDWASLNHYN